MSRHFEQLKRAEAAAAGWLQQRQGIELVCQQRVLDAFVTEKVGEEHLHGTTGYGHDDLGRQCLERVFARVFEAEAALVRPHFASGTHALATALFGVLRPGDELLSVVGAPYDTMEEVIGTREEGQGSLIEWGVTYRELPLQQDGTMDWDGLATCVRPETRMVLIQRSRGYAWRPSLTIADIRRTIQILKAQKPDLICFVDNCYGEFTEDQEPIAAGADLVAGSLIKNPGGGITPCGGYVVGREDLVNQAACRLYAPGIGRDGGATLDFNRIAFQGLFMAPHTVSQALQGAILASQLFSDLGFATSPGPGDTRSDIIQAIRFGSADRLVAFCRGVQKASPIGAYVTPIPWQLPGYGDEVVMAGGTFIEGSTIELSADGPLREPFVGYWQGGLSYAHCRLGLLSALAELEEVSTACR
ncbi:MAG: methionine gamma-lyase family protein [Candidatus Sericytochromatia bacterium]|nr:methionine gamma-lyase family protein [Candidatus Sericytochromatia bacterium]